MDELARCEGIDPCGSKGEKHFNQHTMLELSKSSFL